MNYEPFEGDIIRFTDYQRMFGKECIGRIDCVGFGGNLHLTLLKPKEELGRYWLINPQDIEHFGTELIRIVLLDKFSELSHSSFNSSPYLEI